MPKIFSFSLFFVSFFPLWLSIVFIDLKSIIENDTNLWTEKIGIGFILVLMIVSIGVLAFKLKNNGLESTQQFKLVKVKEEKKITSEYLLSYILPLFAFNFTLWSEVVTFLIFYLTLGFLCIKHNYFSTNILLELFGFSFYRCVLENSDKNQLNTLVISRENLLECRETSLYIKQLNNDVKLNVPSTK